MCTRAQPIYQSADIIGPTAPRAQNHSPTNTQEARQPSPGQKPATPAAPQRKQTAATAPQPQEATWFLVALVRI